METIIHASEFLMKVFTAGLIFGCVGNVVCGLFYEYYRNKSQKYIVTYDRCDAALAFAIFILLFAVLDILSVAACIVFNILNWLF